MIWPRWTVCSTNRSMKRLLTLVLLLVEFLAGAQTKKYTYIVSQDGSGDFQTVQEAIDACPAFGRKAGVSIFVKSGVYEEKVTVPQSKRSVHVVGENPYNTVITWDDYVGKKTGSGIPVSASSTATLSVIGEDFLAENITVRNISGDFGQASAISVDGDRASFVGCRFLSNQNTVSLNGDGKRQYFYNCFIEGTSDMVSGSGTAWFEKCTLRSKKDGSVTSPSTEQGVGFGLVFSHCRLIHSSRVSACYLGRPLKQYGMSVFMECELGDHILSEGWHNWNKKFAESTAYFAEYQNYGPGAVKHDKRVRWSRQLTSKLVADFTVENVLHLSEWFYKDGFMTYSVRAVRGEMMQYPDAQYDWNPVTAMQMQAFLAAAETYPSQDIIEYVRRWADSMVTPEQKIVSYSVSECNLSKIAPARVYLKLSDIYKDNKDDFFKYTFVAGYVRCQIDRQPRTRSDMFWRDALSEDVVSLSDFWAAMPFYAEFSYRYGDGNSLAFRNDLLNDIGRIYKKSYETLRDRSTGLYFDAYDESHQSPWAEKRTGLSSTMNACATGLYAASLVDVLDSYQEDQPYRAELIRQLGELAESIRRNADSVTGLWRSSFELPSGEDNDIEACASALIIYSITKAVNKGWLDAGKWCSFARNAFDAFVENFVSENEDGQITLRHAVNQPMAVPAFILASLENEKLK